LYGCESLLPLGAACLLSNACFDLGLDRPLVRLSVRWTEALASPLAAGSGKAVRAVGWGRRLASRRALVLFKSGKRTDPGIGLVGSRWGCRSDLGTTLGSNKAIFQHTGLAREIFTQRLQTGGPELDLWALWVELCPPRRYVQALFPGACSCDLLWKWDSCRRSQVTMRSLGWP